MGRRRKSPEYPPAATGNGARAAQVDLARRLQEAMDGHAPPLDAETVATAAGVSVSSVYAALRADKSPTFTVLHGLAAATDKPLAWLVGGVEYLDL